MYILPGTRAASRAYCGLYHSTTPIPIPVSPKWVYAQSYNPTLIWVKNGSQHPALPPRPAVYIQKRKQHTKTEVRDSQVGSDIWDCLYSCFWLAETWLLAARINYNLFTY